MRYSIRRIGLGSALRMSLLLGWLVALCPALCLAGLAVQLLRILSRALAQVQTLDITVLGQKIATIDPLALLQLRGTADSIDRLTATSLGTFLLFALVLLIVGGVMFVGVGLLVSMAYNLIAPLVGGLEVELERGNVESERRS
ncbi:MAG TPA: DUF3566 domain-containing protein [Roseiflexaceae bacterium]|nr:DUF3566 domain-containing protein [Roseiflexaceae bacterium]